MMLTALLLLPMGANIEAGFSLQETKDNLKTGLKWGLGLAGAAVFYKLGRLAWHKYNAAKKLDAKKVSFNPLIEAKPEIVPANFDQWIQEKWDSGAALYQDTQVFAEVRKFTSTFDIKHPNGNLVHQKETRDGELLPYFTVQEREFVEAVVLAIQEAKNKALEMRNTLAQATCLSSLETFDTLMKKTGFINDAKTTSIMKSGEWYRLDLWDINPLYTALDHEVEKLQSIDLPDRPATFLGKALGYWDTFYNLFPNKNNDYKAARLFVKASKLVDRYKALEACMRAEFSRLSKIEQEQTERAQLLASAAARVIQQG